MSQDQEQLSQQEKPEMITNIKNPQPEVQVFTGHKDQQQGKQIQDANKQEFQQNLQDQLTNQPSQKEEDSKQQVLDSEHELHQIKTVEIVVDKKKTEQTQEQMRQKLEKEAKIKQEIQEQIKKALKNLLKIIICFVCSLILLNSALMIAAIIARAYGTKCWR